MMTIGGLARRTGVPVKALRAYEDMGLIYSGGRSAGNYRMFGEEALWCVGVIGTLRALGLTLAEIRDLAASYLGPADEPIGPALAAVLRSVRARTEQRIAGLHQLLDRIGQFEAANAAELAGASSFRTADPRRAVPTA
jgi:DNA-binding transcriptional MerR regulator